MSNKIFFQVQRYTKIVTNTDRKPLPVNEIGLNLTDDATNKRRQCHAQLVNGRITGFVRSANIYHRVLIYDQIWSKASIKLMLKLIQK